VIKTKIILCGAHKILKKTSVIGQNYKMSLDLKCVQKTFKNWHLFQDGKIDYKSSSLSITFFIVLAIIEYHNRKEIFRYQHDE